MGNYGFALCYVAQEEWAQEEWLFLYCTFREFVLKLKMTGLSGQTATLRVTLETEVSEKLWIRH